MSKLASSRLDRELRKNPNVVRDHIDNTYNTPNSLARRGMEPTSEGTNHEFRRFERHYTSLEPTSERSRQKRIQTSRDAGVPRRATPLESAMTRSGREERTLLTSPHTIATRSASERIHEPGVRDSLPSKQRITAAPAAPAPTSPTVHVPVGHPPAPHIGHVEVPGDIGKQVLKGVHPPQVNIRAPATFGTKGKLIAGGLAAAGALGGGYLLGRNKEKQASIIPKAVLQAGAAAKMPVGFWGKVLDAVAEPAFLGMLAAPVIGAGVGHLSNSMSAKKEQQAHELAYRDMLALHPSLKGRSSQQVRLIHNSLHNVNPTLARDPLVAGALIDNIMTAEDHGGAGPGQQALLAAVKDLSGIRSNLANARRSEMGSGGPGQTAARLTEGFGKALSDAHKGGIEAAWREVEGASKAHNEYVDTARATLRENLAVEALAHGDKLRADEGRMREAISNAAAKVKQEHAKVQAEREQLHQHYGPPKTSGLTDLFAALGI